MTLLSSNYRYDMTDELYGETFSYFADLFNTPNAFTFLTLDDDVVRAISKLNSKIGYPITRIPNRKIGINMDGVSELKQGLFKFLGPSLPATHTHKHKNKKDCMESSCECPSVM